MVRVPLLVCALGPVDRLPAGGSPLRAQPDLFEHLTHAVTGVQVIVHHQGPQPLQLLDLGGVFFHILEPQAEFHGKCAAPARRALHLDGAAHHLHNILGDGHAQAGALDAALGGGALPLKWVKDVLDKLRRHTDAVVLHRKDIVPIAVAEGGFLADPEGDHPPGGGILHRVAQQVDEHLVQLQGIGDNVLVDHLEGVDKQFQLLGLHLGLDDVHQIVHQLRDVALLLLDLHLAALDAAHVQDVVDEAEQVVAGRQHLL